MVTVYNQACFTYTAQNAVISPIFLVRKICGKQQFPLSSRRIAQKVCGNYVFQQKFHTRELSEIAVFYAVTCKVNTPHITGNEPHCISLTGNTFKDSKNSFEYGRKCNATELSNFIWENNPKNISTMLELDILEKSKAYKPG